MPQESVGVRDINQGCQPHLCGTLTAKVLGAAASPVAQCVALGVWLLPRRRNQNSLGHDHEFKLIVGVSLLPHQFGGQMPLEVLACGSL